MCCDNTIEVILVIRKWYSKIEKELKSEKNIRFSVVCKGVRRHIKCVRHNVERLFSGLIMLDTIWKSNSHIWVALDDIIMSRTHMMYDRLVGWWIIYYIMLGCYGWNQDIVFSGKKIPVSKLLRCTLLLKFV